ncbi:AAA family ATPase [Cellulomonas sp. PhB143]|uniref:AAA family ATPase n=1 Tax=Cellulomonas sp. PhB143 TaxID=2485186 RepID=UPI00131552D1|nr:AAA family ATPase [Cellulomonas sp. PhB143]
MTLTSFSLYRVKPTVTVPIDKDVFCLAGANGLGKSTFIAALNYGLTGGVAPPGVRVEQLPKYQRDAAAYGTRYFTGRISELDRESSSVELKFTIGTSQYRIRRRFFSPHELEHLSVTDNDGNALLPHDATLDAEQRNILFQEQLLEDSGLQTFAQFVFMQHFVLSFDEHRHLLFWDTRATELVLYLALGLDPSLAKQVDELRKAAAAAGSQARNAQYQATLARNEVNQVLGQLNKHGGVDSAVVDEYRSLQANKERITAERDALRTQLVDAQLEFAESSASLMRTRQEYDRAFMRRIGQASPTSGSTLHPAIDHILRDHACRICGTQHAQVPARIEAELRDGNCPLCAAKLPDAQASPSDSQSALVRLDAEMASFTEKTGSLSRTIERLDQETRSKQRELAAAITASSGLQERYQLPSAVNEIDAPDIAMMRERARQLEGSVDVLLGRKEEHLQRRAEAIAAYEPIQAALKSAWNAAEAEFVPRFRRLAEEFIGLPLQVTLDAGSGVNGMAHLALSVNSTHRRRAEQLSESQRFFLDIALRMSLAQHMTIGEGPACLLVDTPEGALDIAYEAKAGEMFASFTADGDQLVMTANVNTSQLLRRMAERCGRERMEFVRMTEWTTLTDVQTEEEGLFNDAFSAIESALDQGPKTAGVQ